jgi:hypothetical protein
MSVSYDTPVRPVPEQSKIHSGRYTHDQLPQLPCSARPTHHLRDNNLLGLQAAFQCGTVHHSCTGVRLSKITDNNPLFNRANGSHVGKINRYMRSWSGPLSDQTRDDLAANDLRGLSTFFYLSTNDPHPYA